MHRNVVPLELHDDVGEMTQDGQDVIQPPSEEFRAIGLFAAEADVAADRVVSPAISELAVMGDEDSTAFRCVNGLVVIGGICTASLACSPDLVPSTLERTSTPRIDIVIEVEAHLPVHRAPDSF